MAEEFGLYFGLFEGDYNKIIAIPALAEWMENKIDQTVNIEGYNFYIFKSGVSSNDLLELLEDEELDLEYGITNFKYNKSTQVWGIL